jgi:hypothetical protein
MWSRRNNTNAKTKAIAVEAHTTLLSRSTDTVPMTLEQFAAVIDHSSPNLFA